jgi:hypothetical protein
MTEADSKKNLTVEQLVATLERCGVPGPETSNDGLARSAANFAMEMEAEFGMTRMSQPSYLAH